MKLTLKYGRGDLPVDVPSGVEATVIRKPPMPTIDDTASEILAAFSSPVGCPPLAELAQKSRSACIAICDITRPVPNHLFLRPMIETLLSAGMQRCNIMIVVATGLHRPNQGDELAELIGDPWVLENIAVENHFARRDDEHIDLGRTSTRGTAVRIDRRFAEADLRIVTGLVEPHFMAGYSGGRKVVAPGLAHAETITTFHSARFMADPAASNCNLIGNPLHEEQLEIVRMLGDVYALNTVIDEDRRMSLVNFGEVTQSHHQAVEYVRRFCELPIERQFQTVVTSSAGYPLDKTYYQTIKGMVSAIDILAPGGNLVIVSQCSEGMGSPEFIDSQQRLVQQGPDAFLAQIMKQSHAAIDEWQTQKQLEPMATGQVHLYADQLPVAHRALTGISVIESVTDTIRQSVAERGDPAVAFIPEGPYVVPLYRPSVSATS
tara:strand:+ start:91575 stop:92876 length:1302 start_codon:yes stop_codon:yes gene_type:complete